MLDIATDLKIYITKTPKIKPDYNNLGFGTYFTDHFFEMDYHSETGWTNAQIKPYQNIEISPASMVFHYGQAVFEGMKAYYSANGNINLFRPFMNMKRLNASSERLCIPKVDDEFLVYAIKSLVRIDKGWIPKQEGTSLYIRPFIIATEPVVRVKTSEHYKLMIILSPVAAYYPEGLNPVKIMVESNYVRAVKGGMGNAKTAGNYASGLKAQTQAKDNGHTQVLWLDGIERKYVEEVGTMNVFFRFKDKIVTPSLSGSILPGITRDSVIQLLKIWGEPIEERQVSISEVYNEYKNGNLLEAFGTGTAAVISPIGQLQWEEKVMVINNGETGQLSQKLYNTITSIQYGKQEAPEEGWIVNV
jgi:branched-chain amino acid aminotransferase